MGQQATMPIIAVPDPAFVKRARARLGCSQRELAEKLGLERRSIIRYEQGWPLPERTKLAIQRLLEIAEHGGRKRPPARGR
jgi:DNA-binding XRE family transcriptional regulator